MRALLVTGIWPPDLGGPASHVPELAAYLRGRGHAIEVVTTADGPPPPAPYPVRWIARSLPVPARYAAVSAEVARRARAADVVYATSMVGRAALGAVLARRPIVVRLAGDAAYERARRKGLYAGDLQSFQCYRGDARVAALRAVRDRSLALARHVVCPSTFLRDIVIGWGVPARKLTVVPNAGPDDLAETVEELRRQHGFRRPTLVFGGRLTTAKALPVLLEAVASVEGVDLVLAGDGPDRDAAEAQAARLGLGARVRFLGAMPREGVLELFKAADATVLSSAWENFPHGIVESLAVGTPVIATSVGGVPEVVTDGDNGLLISPGDPAALAAAVRRYLSDPALRARLEERARPSVADYAPERLLARIESILEAAR